MSIQVAVTLLDCSVDVPFHSQRKFFSQDDLWYKREKSRKINLLCFISSQLINAQKNSNWLFNKRIPLIPQSLSTALLDSNTDDAGREDVNHMALADTTPQSTRQKRGMQDWIHLRMLSAPSTIKMLNISNGFLSMTPCSVYNYIPSVVINQSSTIHCSEGLF